MELKSSVPSSSQIENIVKTSKKLVKTYIELFPYRPANLANQHFYLECCTGLEWVKREHSLPHVLNLSLPKSFLESFVYRTQNSGQSSTPFWRLRLKRGSFVRPPSNGEGFKDIQ